MVTQKPKRKLTYEDYAKTPEGERWELIDGELINHAAFMAPSARRSHQSECKCRPGGSPMSSLCAGEETWVKSLFCPF